GTPIASRSSDDAEQRYFIYRYVYEMGKILNADPTRIQVASLSNGSVVVNTVFMVVGTWNDIKSTDERSPWGLISLLKALQADTSSQLYQSPFFKFIDRSAMPEPLPVRLCDDGVFRVFCPYTGGIMSTGEALGILFLGIAIVPLALGCLCCGLWHIDVDKGSVVDVDDVVEKLQEDPSQVDPKLQIEYAESWLQGRFMGEEWQKQRRVIASIAPGSQGSGIESKSAAAPRQHTYPVKGRVAQVLFQRNPSARRCMAELMVSCSDRAVDGAAKEANRHRFDTRL
ncbi:unnamed protein product, partial [Symbiodinium microadriaticum]